MTAQTEAQRLAKKMKSYKLVSGYAWHCHKAGDELLRLEAANDGLLEALISIAEDSSDEGARECAMDAIKKHGGQL